MSSIAPRSPSMAFEPTPAVDLVKENFSLRTENPHVSTLGSRLERTPSKEVRFSPPASEPARRAQSLTAVPFLEPVSSASPLPRSNTGSQKKVPEVGMNAYLEQSRSLLESQRLNFEQERESFEQERRLWGVERAMLQARIADLQFSVNKTSPTKRRFSNDTPSTSAEFFRKDSGLRSSLSSLGASRESSETTGATPVWEIPDMGAKATRVFPNEEIQFQPVRKSLSTSSGLPSIAEGMAERQLPRSVAVPVEIVDSSLDGITLKSAGLESSFVRFSPPSPVSPTGAPSPGLHINDGEKDLHLPQDGLLTPPNVNLVRNAGHTPMELGQPAVSGEIASGPESRKSPEADIGVSAKRRESDISSSQRGPPLPPSEKSDFYCASAVETEVHEVPPSKIDTDNDMALKGPLTMESKPLEGQDNDFLDQLDKKLSVEAAKPRADADASDMDEDSDDAMPRLKLKQSLNFGSVYGSARLGNI